MFRTLAILFIGTLLFSFSACQQTEKEKSAPGVVVSIAPQQYFASYLLGDVVPVYVMVPPGTPPESFEPAPSDIARLENALAYVRIGHIGFELGWMDRIQELYPELLIIDASEGISLLSGDCTEHDHGDHHHGHGTDPHIWTSPQRAQWIAENTWKGLKNRFPEMSDSLDARHQRLQADILALDDSLRLILHDSANRSFAIFHPALAYLAEDYGLEQIAIEKEGKEPSPAQMKLVMDQIEEKNIRLILVQKEFSREQAEGIAKASGIRIEVIDPLSPDWPAGVLHTARLIAGDTD